MIFERIECERDGSFSVTKFDSLWSAQMTKTENGNIDLSLVMLVPTEPSQIDDRILAVSAYLRRLIEIKEAL